MAILAVLLVAWTYTAVVNAAQAEPATFLRSGVNMVYASGSDATHDICRLIRGAERSVKLLDTYFGHFDPLQAALGDALIGQPNLELQVLIARPDGHLSNARGAYSRESIASNVRSAHLRINDFRRQYDELAPGVGPRVSVRSFDVLVPGPIFIIDDRHVFVGTFLQHTGSQNTPMIRMDRSGWWRRWWPKVGVPDAYCQTFELLWKADESSTTS